jgi:hypothetical protein
MHIKCISNIDLARPELVSQLHAWLEPRIASSPNGRGMINLDNVDHFVIWGSGGTIVHVVAVDAFVEMRERKRRREANHPHPRLH